MSITRTLRRNKLKIAIAAAAIALIAAGATFALNSRNTSSAGDTSPTAEETDVVAEESQAESPTDGLSEEQRTLVSSYGTPEKDLIGILCDGTWATADGKYKLTFDENTYIELANDKRSEHTFAISHIDKAEGERGSTSYEVVMLTDTGSHVVSLSTGFVSANGNGEHSKTSSIQSKSLFAKKSSTYETNPYLRAESAPEIGLASFDESSLSVLATDRQALVEAISKWCAVQCPTATEAAWNSTVSIDYANHAHTTGFTLNDTSKTSINVSYNDATSAFSITKQSKR